MAFDDHSIIDKKMSACLLVPGIEISVLHGGPGSAVLHAEGTVVRRAVAFAGFLHRSRLSLKWTSVYGCTLQCSAGIPENEAATEIAFMNL